ncbi:MAG: cytochrome d ubiquinol oxidase subunit II [Solirubrobacterales bacterium]
MTEICLALALLGVSAYAVLGGADFGAGFWDLTAGGAQRGSRVRAVIERSMHTVWEVNHVWLIFVLVVLWTCFPKFFGSAMSSLAIPMVIASLGIILRGTAFAVRGQAATINEARVLGAVFALSSVIVPFALGAAIGGIASGRVHVGNATSDLWSVWLNPTSLLIGTLAVATGAYLAAVFLAGDSQKLALPDMVTAFRRRAIGSAIVAGALAIGGLFVLRSDARSLYDGLTSGGGLVCVVGSAVLGGLTFGLVLTNRFGLARATSAGAVVAIILGWAFAQSPYLLPGELTLDQAAAPDATLQAVLIAVAIGLVLLVPALVWLYRLALGGDISEEFLPFDERFRAPESQEEQS